MANEVSSSIRFYGNQSVMDLYREIIRRFSEDMRISKQQYDMSAIKRVLFGLKEEDEFDTYVEVGSKWAHPEDTGILSFRSAWTPLNELQDYITKHAALIDKDVVTLMTYEDESPLFVGARYCLLKDGNVVSYISEEDMEGWHFVSEDEMEDAIKENEETGEYENIVDIDSINDYLLQCKSNALEDVLNENPQLDKVKHLLEVM